MSHLLFVFQKQRFIFISCSSHRSHFCEEESEERRDFSKGKKKIKMSGEKFATMKK